LFRVLKQIEQIGQNAGDPLSITGISSTRHGPSGHLFDAIKGFFA
jgi:hypothetical protein